MPFEKGNKLGNGRPLGSRGAQRKENFHFLMEEVFSSKNPRQKLEDLLENDPKEFFRIYTYLMPKDSNVNANHNHTFTPIQLQKCIKRVHELEKEQGKQGSG